MSILLLSTNRKLQKGIFCYLSRFEESLLDLSVFFAFFKNMRKLAEARMMFHCNKSNNELYTDIENRMGRWLGEWFERVGDGISGSEKEIHRNI